MRKTSEGMVTNYIKYKYELSVLQYLPFPVSKYSDTKSAHGVFNEAHFKLTYSINDQSG